MKMDQELFCSAMAVFLTSTAVVSVAAAAPEAARARPAIACSAEAITAPPNSTITSVQSFDTPVKYCRVDGYVTTVDPGPNQVHFSIALPEAWSGRYLMAIPGGGAGFIANPVDFDLKRGTAAATTDKGSGAKSIADLSFVHDPARETDFAYRGAYVSITATQAITKQYYKQPKFYRYVTGCSGGGLATWATAARYPEVADAFLPEACSDGPALTRWGQVMQYVSRDRARWLSAEDLKRVEEVIQARFDDSDGAKDNLIWDPSKIVLTPELFPFLSAAQFSTLKLMASELPAAPGVPDQRVPPFTMSHLTTFSGLFGNAPPPWTAETQPSTVPYISSWMAKAMGKKDFNLLTDMDYTSYDMMRKMRQMYVGEMNWWSGVSPDGLWRAHDMGKKILFFTGSADEMAPTLAQTEFYERIADRYAPSSDNFIRYFVVPGTHCRATKFGPTDLTDKMLEAAEAWVEKNQAPDSVILSNHSPQQFRAFPANFQNTPSTDSVPKRTYLACAAPRHSVFKGGLANTEKLDVNDAKNWTCEE